jgi:hypothetical protein
MTARSEASYQKHLIKKLLCMFPGSFIIKNDPSENQGIPDLLLLFGDQWAMLEVKADPLSHIQPNQEYYIEFFNGMSFCAFINPSVEEQVIYDLQRAFGIIR